MQIDGIVNHVDAVVAGMIAALVAVRDGNMSPEPLCVFHSRQCKQLRNQVAGNIRRYEPGRRERINQDLQLAHFKWPTVVKVFILRLKNALFPAKIGNKAFSNEALNIETVRDAIRTRDLPLRRRTLYPAELRKPVNQSNIYCIISSPFVANQFSVASIYSCVPGSDQAVLPERITFPVP